MTRSRIIAGRAVIIIEAQDHLNRVLTGVRNKVTRFANEVGKLGEGLFRTGFFGALASGAGITAFVRFDDVMRELQVVLEKLSPSARQTDRQFINLEQTILRLGRSTSFTSVQVAEAAVELGKAGLDADQVAGSLQSVLDLARGTGIDTARAVQIFVRAISAFTSGGTDFQTAISESGKIVSQFIKAVNTSVLDLEDLEASLRYTQGSASNLAISLAETLAILSELANQGLVGSIGGTSLNTALLNLVKKQEELAAAGINIELNSAGGVDIIRTLQNIFSALQQFNRVDQARIIGDIFNIRGGRAIQAARELENIVKTLRNVRNASDEARRAADLREGGLGGAFRRLYSTVEQLGIALTSLVENILKPFVETIKGLTDALASLAKSNPVLAGTIFLSPGILLASGVALIALSKALRLAAAAAGLLRASLSGALGLLGKGAGAQLVSFGKLAGAAKVGLTAQRSLPQVRGLGISQGAREAVRAQSIRKAYLGQAVAANKVADALRRRAQYEKIIAFNRARNVRGLTTFTGGAAGATRTITTAQRIAQARAGAQAAAQIARGATITRNQAIGRALAGGGRAFVNVARGIGSMAKGFLLATRTIGRFVFSFGGVLTILEGLLLFTDLPQRFGRAFSNAFTAIANTARYALGPIELIKTAFQAFSEGRQEIGVTALSEGLSALVAIIGNQLVAAWARFKEAIAPVVDFFHILWTLVVQITDSVFQFIKNFGTGIFTSISKTLENTGAASLFSGDGGSFTQTLLQVASSISQFVPQLFAWISDLQDAFLKGGEVVQAYIARAFNVGNIGIDTETADRLLSSAIDEINSRFDLRARKRELGLEQQQSAIAAAFERSSEEINRRTAERRAEASRQIGAGGFERANFFQQLMEQMRRRDAAEQLRRQQELQASPGIPDPRALPLIQQAIRQTIPFAAALVTSSQSVRGNILRFGKSTEEQQLAEQKTTNDLLRQQLKNEGSFAFEQ